MKRLLLPLLLMFAAAGCGPEMVTPVADAPTLAVLPTWTDSPTPLPSGTPTVTYTPSVTPTGTLPPTETLTVTPSLTITDTTTPTPSDTPTPTETLPPLEGLSGLAFLAARTTVIPDFVTPGTPPVRSRVEVAARVTSGPTPLSGQPVIIGSGGGPGTPTPLGAESACIYSAPGGFGAVELEAADLVGCPLGAPPGVSTVASAYQPYQGGFMTWVDNPGGAGNIYAFQSDGTYTVYPDTWQAGVDPEGGGESPPDGNLIEPIRGFGKVWRQQPGVRDTLGWATATEVGGEVRLVQYERGLMLFLPQRGQILALNNGGTWRAYNEQF